MSTAKEKAVELVENFIVHTHECDKLEAKQCALIVVNEILDSDPYNLHIEYDFNENKLGVDVEYWGAVKQEIKKL